MAIKIVNPPTGADQSPHAEAAANLTGTDVTTVTTSQENEDTGESDVVSHEMDTKNVFLTVPDKERVTVGMEFKMPLAQYVMIKFYVSRATDCDPENVDAIYDQNKGWVEARINALIEEQQQPGQ
jgi:adenosyl cobinamide kinase/adenosyl cobinamide phosphate guanylyltransferase